MKCQGHSIIFFKNSLFLKTETHICFYNSVFQ
jgi:hypothetical protein